MATLTMNDTVYYNTKTDELVAEFLFFFRIRWDEMDNWINLGEL
jgi:hypothetical protein